MKYRATSVNWQERSVTQEISRRGRWSSTGYCSE